MKRYVLWCTALLIYISPALTAEAVCPDRTELKPGNHVRTVSVDGTERRYILHAPPGRSSSGRTAVVLNFHGGGHNAEKQIALSQMNITSDAHGFLVVYPEGTRALFGEAETWNAGSCCGAAVRRNVDDVKFTAAIIDDLESNYCIDDRRVFATGISNGAMMAYRLACELSDRIAAIAPVGATIGISECRPSRPVSVIHFHGTADEFAPFGGGYGKIRASGNFKSVPDTIARFTMLNGCKEVPEVTYQRGDALCRSYPSCKDKATVTLCLIEGGGHTWSGGSPFPTGGKTSYDISANEQMWKFFQAHPR
jgi:polyhydroxybutyrate depolymerase